MGHINIFLFKNDTLSLQTLHPLLEDGCPDDEDPEPYKKVKY